MHDGTTKKQIPALHSTITWQYIAPFAHSPGCRNILYVQHEYRVALHCEVP